MRRKSVVIIILLLTIISCEEISHSITPTRLVVENTILPEKTSTPVGTLLPLLSTPTLHPSEIIFQSTQKAFNDLLEDFPNLCENYPWKVLESPDNQWLSQDCTYDSLQVINKDGLRTWKITYEEIFGDSEYYPDNQGGISPQKWTNNSQYLYFSPYTCCWDPGISLLADIQMLYRLNISNGTYRLIRTGLFDFSLSPTDRRIAFIEILESPLKVEIQDLIVEDIRTIKLNIGEEYNQANIDIWSEDGLMLAVSAVSGINYSHEIAHNDKFSLIIIDLQNNSQKVILRDFETSFLSVVEWSENNVLRIQSGDGASSEIIQFFEYDLKSDILTLVD